MVQRAFLLGGVRQEPRTIIEVSDSLARELVHTGKAELVASESPPAPAPMTVADSPALVPPVAEGDEAADGPPGEAETEQAPRRRRKGTE